MSQLAIFLTRKIFYSLQNESTALHIAALGGHMEVLEMLLSRGASSEAIDKVGKRTYQSDVTVFDSMTVIT